MDEQYGPRLGIYNLREWHKPRHFNHIQAIRDLTHMVMAQYGMNKGLKLFKEKGDEAVSKELQQLYVQKVGSLRHTQQMTSKQK